MSTTTLRICFAQSMSSLIQVRSQSNDKNMCNVNDDDEMSRSSCVSNSSSSSSSSSSSGSSFDSSVSSESSFSSLMSEMDLLQFPNFGKDKQMRASFSQRSQRTHTTLEDSHFSHSICNSSAVEVTFDDLFKDPYHRSREAMRPRKDLNMLFSVASSSFNSADFVACDFVANTATREGSPEDELQKILQDDIGKISISVEDYFVPVTEARKRAYTKDVAQAVRREDLETLQDIIVAGGSLDACNTQGESLIHIACRRHNFRLLEFLVQQGHVSLKVRDDCGKTALHELCWSFGSALSNSMEAIYFCIQTCPELLFCKDERGFTPFHYVPRNSWPVFATFVQEHERLFRLQAKLVQFKSAHQALTQQYQTEKPLNDNKQ